MKNLQQQDFNSGFVLLEQQINMIRKEDVPISCIPNVMRSPAAVANNLLQGLHTASQPSSVSILFADVVDYTALRGSMQPVKLSDLLTRLFAKLDLLADQHAVQRVDAIDGCYIAAANFSTRQPKDHALRLARFAVDAMAAASATPLDEGLPELGTVRLQAGLHCGAVCGCMMGAHGVRKHTPEGTERTACAVEATRRKGMLEAPGRRRAPTYWLGRAAGTSEGDSDLWAVAARAVAARAGSDARPTTGDSPERRGRAVAAGSRQEGPLGRGRTAAIMMCHGRRPARSDRPARSARSASL